MKEESEQFKLDAFDEAMEECNLESKKLREINDNLRKDFNSK